MNLTPREPGGETSRTLPNGPVTPVMWRTFFFLDIIDLDNGCPHAVHPHQPLHQLLAVLPPPHHHETASAAMPTSQRRGHTPPPTRRPPRHTRWAVMGSTGVAVGTTPQPLCASPPISRRCARVTGGSRRVRLPACRSPPRHTLTPHRRRRQPYPNVAPRRARRDTTRRPRTAARTAQQAQQVGGGSSRGSGTALVNGRRRRRWELSAPPRPSRRSRQQPTARSPVVRSAATGPAGH